MINAINFFSHNQCNLGKIGDNIDKSNKTKQHNNISM